MIGCWIIIQILSAISGGLGFSRVMVLIIIDVIFCQHGSGAPVAPIFGIILGKMLFVGAHDFCLYV